MDVSVTDWNVLIDNYYYKLYIWQFKMMTVQTVHAVKLLICSNFDKIRITTYTNEHFSKYIAQ